MFSSFTASSAPNWISPALPLSARTIAAGNTTLSWSRSDAAFRAAATAPARSPSACRASASATYFAAASPLLPAASSALMPSARTRTASRCRPMDIRRSARPRLAIEAPRGPTAARRSHVFRSLVQIAGSPLGVRDREQGVLECRIRLQHLPGLGDRGLEIAGVHRIHRVVRALQRVAGIDLDRLPPLLRRLGQVADVQVGDRRGSRDRCRRPDTAGRASRNSRSPSRNCG